MANTLGHEDQDEDAPQVLDANDDTDTSQQQEIPNDTGVEVVEDDGQEDKRIAATDEGEGDDDDEVDTKPNRKRESAKERRDRQKQAKERDKQTIELLQRTVAKQNETVEQLRQATIANQVTELDNRIATAVSEHDQMVRVEAAALNAKNGGADAVKARQLAEEARQKAWAFDAQKQQLIAAANKKPEPVKAPVPYADKAQHFLSDKPWYNPAKGDEDSLVVEALDRALSKQMDPNDPKYWTTLDRKVKAALPHKFEADDAEDDQAESEIRQEAPQRRKGPPTGGTNRSSGSGGTSERISLPKEMVDAMKEAGYWDDPKKRLSVAKRYQEQLKNQRNG